MGGVEYSSFRPLNVEVLLNWSLLMDDREFRQNLLSNRGDRGEKQANVRVRPPTKREIWSERASEEEGSQEQKERAQQKEIRQPKRIVIVKRWRKRRRALVLPAVILPRLQRVFLLSSLLLLHTHFRRCRL